MVANTAFAIASFAAFVAALPAPDAAPGVIPFARSNYYETRANGEVDGPLFLQNLNNTLKKYHAQTLPSFGLASALERRAGTGAVALTDQVESGKVDELYYGSGTVGATKPQTFTFDFDTGSADLFIPGPKCTKAKGCVGTTKYSQGGTSEGNTTTVTYGSGQVSGNNYFDTVCVAGRCAAHTNVISLTTASGFATSDSNSLMGLGFSTIAESKQPTFFERLIALGQVSKNEFGFFLGRAKSGTQGRSELFLGGSDTSRYIGKPAAHPVTTKGYWQIAVAGVKVKGTNAPGSAGQAAIDTGTTVIIAPTVAATAIFALIPGALPLPLASGSATETVFAYPCNTKAIPAITFGGKSYAINPLDFSLGTLTSDFASLVDSSALSKLLDGALLGNLCLASIIGADIESAADPTQLIYVVGDSFLKNWYSIYSYDNGASVSFAKSV